MQIPELLDRTVSLLYPQRCIRCEELVEYDDIFCEGCPTRAARQITLTFTHKLADIAASYEYKGHGRRLVWAVKEGEPRRVRYILAREMQTILNERWGDVAFDMIVPVPATKAKLEERGFNHAELLAEQLGKLAELPIYPEALVRAEDSQVQHNLDKAQREKNAGLSYLAGQAEGLRGKTVLLVDDLITTGWTLAVCAGRLIDCGAAQVYALAAATTPSR